MEELPSSQRDLYLLAMLVLFLLLVQEVAKFVGWGKGAYKKVHMKSKGRRGRDLSLPLCS